MKIRTFMIFMAVCLPLALVGCNLPVATPSPDPGMAYTVAAQTIAAQLTLAALTFQAPSPTSLALPATSTSTPQPTFAPPPTGIFTATQECDRGQFISDVTIPDGSVVLPGQVFTKTWRLKNIGACTWSSYSLVFDEGNSMSGTATTSVGTTPPGSSVDISISLTAPNTPGSYRGYWRIRNASGVLIPISGGHNGKSFYVDIQVVAPTNTPIAFNVPYLPAESGLVTSSGGTNTLTVAAGDSGTNEGVEAFLSFDISSIPANAKIQSATLRLIGGGQVRGDPFATLGCLRGYVQNYGTIDPGDFVAPGASGAFAQWCNAGTAASDFSNSALVSAIQNAVGANRFRIRLQFRDTLTDNDNTIDDVLLISPVTLTVTYNTP